MNSGHYVPILTGKRGEIVAIRELPAAIRSGMTPLLDIPPAAKERDRPGKPASPPDPVAKLNKLFKQLEEKWDSDRDVLLDLDGYEQYRPRGEHPVEIVANRIEGQALRFELVVSSRSDPAYIDAARATAHKWQGFCLRIHIEPGQTPVTTGAEIERLQAALDVAPISLDLLIDLGDLAKHEGAEPVELARLHLGAVGSRTWRGITLASTAVPDSERRNISQGGSDRFRRLDWQLWRTLTQEHGFEIGFGDYSIIGPRPRTDEPSWNPAPHLRYTTEKALLWWRGHLDDADADQDQVRLKYPDLCRLAVAHPDCKPSSFSWGDEMIRAKAGGRDTRVGAPSTWIEHATNHHITLVVKSLRALSG